MALSDVQAGRIGEFLLAVCAMLTSDGALAPFRFRAYPDRDDAAAPFRVQTRDLGPRLLKMISALPPATKPLPGARLVVIRR
jgi:hypothetical protein